MTKQPKIYIISGGAGSSGEQLVNTVLAQFPQANIQVTRLSNMRLESQIEAAIQQAAEETATVVYTLVDSRLRNLLARLVEEKGVASIDLMGPLIDRIRDTTGQASLEQPGLYRTLNKQYFDRVAAIEYTIAHDDGKDPQSWLQAEIVLLGPSRSGKTPLCLYLSVLGWKAANVPLIPGLDLASEFSQLDKLRVIGLRLEAGQLLAFRQQRQQRLGIAGPSAYTDPEKIYEELEYTKKIYRRYGITTIDVTDKPIESSADEIIRVILSRQDAFIHTSGDAGIVP